MQNYFNQINVFKQRNSKMNEIRTNENRPEPSNYVGVLRLSPDIWIILGCLSQLERELIRERVRAGMKNAKAKGKIFGRVRKRNDVLIHSLLQAGLSFREVARIARVSHGSVSASKKEWLAKKSDEERLKFEQLKELQGTELGVSKSSSY